MWCHLGSDGALLELQDETAESGRYRTGTAFTTLLIIVFGKVCLFPELIMTF